MTGHLPEEMLLRAMDGELSPAENLTFERHLKDCPECQEKYEDCAKLSARLEALVALEPLTVPRDAHTRLALALEAAGAAAPVMESSPASRPLRRFAWVTGIAAGLAICVMLVGRLQSPAVGTQSGLALRARPIQNANADQQPVKKHVLLASEESPSGVSAEAVGDNVEDSFVALPYSLDDSASGASHIVRVQLPAASLADVGLLVAPGADDEWVQADLLMGMDGQPRGIRLVSQRD